MTLSESRCDYGITFRQDDLPGMALGNRHFNPILVHINSIEVAFRAFVSQAARLIFRFEG